MRKEDLGMMLVAVGMFGVLTLLTVAAWTAHWTLGLMVTFGLLVICGVL